MEEKELVERCLQNSRIDQKQLYEKFSPLMLGVCMRYANSREEGEDVMIEGFTNVFAHLSEFKFECSLQNWIRRIMLNTAIDHFRMNVKRYHHLSIDDDCVMMPVASENPTGKLMEKDLLNVIQRMPETYRVIFNLFVIEGLSHKEIGEMLDIQECTSRSQLVRAKKWLKEAIER
ncbi:MAG TPA: sigma-70 family RNA polymerase sigma factor [Bacteroidales bacterium]|nr:sigma-70 family RNA polymerase sigma factor [Bacteroidales bacterium]